jgi:hypothetical protein
VADDATATPDDEGSSGQQAALQEVKAAIAAGKTTEVEPTDHLKFLPEQAQWQELQLKREFATQDLALKGNHSKQEIALREMYAKGLFLILAIDLVFVNLLFWVYADKGAHWRVPDAVIQVWLASTVVQVVGIVAVVTRYLFPRRDKAPDSDDRAR